MRVFQRGLSPGFIAVLQELGASTSWWRDILQDTTLLIAVRDEYINVYWQGQSIFKLGYRNKRIVVATHPKYLVDPALKKQVPFDPIEGTFGKLPANAFIQRYDGRETLGKLKSTAGLFAGEEKKGVHEIARQNRDVVDVEIALSNELGASKRKLPRIDIATLVKNGDAAELVFWEAKAFGNKELRSSGHEIPVIEQIENYKLALGQHRERVLSSYRRVASNLVTIASMSSGARTIGPAIRAVAAGCSLTMSSPPQVGLIVFGFDSDQRGGDVWSKVHLPKLESAIGAQLVLSRGDARRLIL